MFQFNNSNKFYQTSTADDSSIEDVLDLILKRYSDVNFIMNMEHTEGFNLVLKALENDAKERLFNQWLHDDVRYEKSFDEYYQSFIPYQKTTPDERRRILEKYGGDAIGSI
ncbi:MAG TPA: hypothetical protein OIL95_13915 [Coprobacillaceae bacterium]|nr:hypothetical protein [Coprobacillaceae bacterium]